MSKGPADSRDPRASSRCRRVAEARCPGFVLHWIWACCVPSCRTQGTPPRGLRRTQVAGPGAWESPKERPSGTWDVPLPGPGLLPLPTPWASLTSVPPTALPRGSLPWGQWLATPPSQLSLGPRQVPESRTTPDARLARGLSRGREGRDGPGTLEGRS